MKMNVQIDPVEVTPINAATTNGPWRVAHGGAASNQANSYPVVHVPVDKGDYTITFNIGGQNDLVFDSTSPIWIQTGGKPSGAVVDNHFKDISVSQDGKTLTLTDSKEDTSTKKSVKFHYQLNFTGNDNNSHKKLDPIILNDGGKGISGFTRLQIVEIGLAALAVIFLAVLTYRKFIAPKTAPIVEHDNIGR
jgi:hypothetical protein